MKLSEMVTLYFEAKWERPGAWFVRLVYAVPDPRGGLFDSTRTVGAQLWGYLLRPGNWRGK